MLGHLLAQIDKKGKIHNLHHRQNKISRYLPQGIAPECKINESGIISLCSQYKNTLMPLQCYNHFQTTGLISYSIA